MHTFGPKTGFTPRQAKIHFLAETERHGFTATKEHDELLALPVDSLLPPHLGIKALFTVYKQQSMPAGTVNCTLADTAWQQQTGRNGATNPTGDSGKSKNPFYHPVPDAVCLACNCRGHKAKTCIMLACFATTMAFYNVHLELLKRVVHQLKAYYTQSKTHPAAVRRIQAAVMDRNEPAPKDEAIMAWLKMMPADF